MVEIFSPSSYAYNSVSTIPEDSPIEDVSRVAAATVAARVLMGNNAPAQQDTNGNGTDNKITREEHAAMMQELRKKRAGWRTPRRGWSSTEAPIAAPPVPELTASYHTPPVSSPPTDQHRQPAADDDDKPSPSRQSQPPISGAWRRQAEEALQQQSVAVSEEQPSTAPVPATGPAPRPRPPMPHPRRSYSVTDYEPPSQTHRPSVRMTIDDLPAELHYAIFDFLDPIDSTCLGLTNRHFYDIHRRMHGSVPLSSRREGPNDLEWAWRGAGPLVHSKPQPQPQSQSQSQQLQKASATDPSGKSTPADKPTGSKLRRTNTSPAVAQESQTQTPSPAAPPLERLRVKGQVYCRKCGISRCELHRHLKTWMVSPAGMHYEYCSVSRKYGPPAPEGAKEFCHLKSPKKPHRCGRHAPAASKASSNTTPGTPGLRDVQSRLENMEA